VEEEWATKQNKRREERRKNENKIKGRNRKKQGKASKGCYGFDVVRCMWCLGCVIQMQKTHTHIHKNG
jgi:hypothetical protein